MAEHDLVIRNGTVIDGTGSDRRLADVAVTDGLITDIGRVDGTGRREVDADGLLVFPGFVDVHTHYDGQATWDRHLAPSSWHGVTTVIAGNCGVGFAPVQPSNHNRLIQLMEGVEDIPGAALHEGLTWEWESFGDYLDFLDGQRRDIDLGTQLPHGPLRLEVMGERGATQEPATEADVAAMADLAAAAVAAGALGFSTSRTLNHRTSLGEPTPTLKAEADELIGIARGAARGGRPVLQVISDFFDLDGEFDLIRSMAALSGLPLSVSVAQNNRQPDLWRELLDRCQAATDAGVTMRGQVGARAIGLLLGHQATLSPFMFSETYQSLADLAHAERMAALARPEVRTAVLKEARIDPNNTALGSQAVHRFDFMFELGDPPNYEPSLDDSIGARARRAGEEPLDYCYDLLLAGDGTGLVYQPVANFRAGNLDVVGEQLRHPASIPGLSDGGAHVGTICDVSFPSTLLQWWGRDRPTGRLPLELLIHKQARLTALALGLADRGVLAPGHKADINVLDFDAMTLHAPELAFDLPAGGKRLLQRVDGYRHTFVGGTEIMADGEATGETPGRLLRGPQTTGGA